MSRLIPLVPAVFVVLWSTGFIGARYAMPHAEPFTFLSLRFLVALAILAPFALTRRSRWPNGATALHAGLAGALIHGLYLGGMFFAIHRGLPAAVASLIGGLQPVLTALVASRALGERLALRQWLGLLLGLLGVALVVLPKLGSPAAGAMDAVTLAPAFLGMAAISLGAIWQKRFVASVDLGICTTLQYLGALVPVALGTLLFEDRAIEWTGELVFALVWLTLVLSIGAIFLFVFMIREGAVSRVSSLMYLTPGVTAVMAYAIFGEALTWLQLAGFAVAGLGVAAATRRRKSRVSADPQAVALLAGSKIEPSSPI